MSEKTEASVKQEEGSFEVTKITKLGDLASGKSTNIPESDLTIQTDKEIIQLEYKKVEKKVKKFKIKPGCFSITDTQMGTILEPFELRKYNLLKTIDNTSAIISEIDKFFGRLDVYKKLKRDPKRAILLCSPPGVGKSSAINEVCRASLAEEGTAVVIWDTSEIRATSVNKFFLSRSEFTPEVKKLIMVIEDIEGGTVENDYGSRGTESSMLNFLDGVGSPFKGIPTFIIATTNNPEKSIGALIDRPGRFDKVIEMKTPSAKECEELLKFIKNQEEDLSEEDMQAAAMAAEAEFSIAHIQEAVVRAELDDISVKDAVKQLVDHKKRFKDAFSKTPKRSMGFM